MASSFLANLNGSGQTYNTSNTAQQITSLVAVTNTGNNFSSDAWTPPAGKVRIGGQMRISGTGVTLGSLAQVMIYKNGSAFAISKQVQGTNNTTPFGVVVDDVANGTDSYKLYCLSIFSSSPPTISGTTTETSFWGYWIDS